MISKRLSITIRLINGNKLGCKIGSKTSNNQCYDGPLTILNLFLEFQVAILDTLGVDRFISSVIGGCFM